MMIKQLVAVAALAAGVAAYGGTAFAAPPSPDNPAGHIGGVIPVQGQARVTNGYYSNNNLSNHGGPTLTTNTVYAIYWSPTALPVSSSYQTTVNGFFADVSAAHDTTSNVYAVDTQYSSIKNAETFQASYVDQSSLPAKACADSVTGSYCLSDAQIQTEITKDVAAAGWTPSSTSLFVMFTPQGVGSCYSSSSCAFTQYCAYHGDYASGGKTYYYANMPYASTDPSACGTGQDPYGDPAAASEINILSHEQNEAITDPALNAWYDRQGNEIGDKCAWKFGSATGASGQEYNQTINGDHYYVQQEWSNRSSGCALHL